MLKLNSKQTSHLRALGHSLNPVVMIGNNGLSEQVMREIDISLKAHELIKIKVFGDDREQRKQMLEAICEQLGAAPIHHIGKQLIVYRPAETPKIALPK
jgi:RNA-binding protein